MNKVGKAHCFSASIFMQHQNISICQSIYLLDSLWMKLDWVSSGNVNQELLPIVLCFLGLHLLKVSSERQIYLK